MKLNFAVFKKGKPIYWIGGAIVLFLIFYFYVSRSSGGSGQAGVSVYNAGPSEAQIAAGVQAMQLQYGANAAALQANNELAAIQDTNALNLAIATLGYQAEIAEINAASDLTHYTAGLDASLQSHYLDTQKEIFALQGEYSLENARVASESAITLRALDVAMFNKSLDTNLQMYQIQSDNLITQSLIGQIGSLKKKDRDETLQIIASNVYGNPVTYVNGPGAARISSDITTQPVPAPAGGLLGRLI